MSLAKKYDKIRKITSDTLSHIPWQQSTPISGWHCKLISKVVGEPFICPCFFSVADSISLFLSFGRSVGWLVGLLVCLLVGWLVSW